MLNLSQNGCSVWVASSTERLLTPTAVALGKFDGVHLGLVEPVPELVVVEAEPEAPNHIIRMRNRRHEPESQVCRVKTVVEAARYCF